LKITLDESGDSFSGPFRYEIIDTNGNVLFSDDGTFSGKRLNVVPLE
jgi:hypothetical protein